MTGVGDEFGVDPNTDPADSFRTLVESAKGNPAMSQVLENMAQGKPELQKVLDEMNKE